MTRQDHATLVLTLYQSRRDQPPEKRVIGVVPFEEMFPPDHHLDVCLETIQKALNDE